MPVRVEKLPNEPIIILTYEGRLDVETVRSAFLQSAAIAEQIAGLVYRISDVRRADADFAHVLKVVAEIRKGLPGSSADPRIRGMFVGTSAMAKLYADILRQQALGGVSIPFFFTPEDALASIRIQMNVKS